jgi:hypothetical protein
MNYLKILKTFAIAVALAGGSVYASDNAQYAHVETIGKFCRTSLEDLEKKGDGSNCFVEANTYKDKGDILPETNKKKGFYYGKCNNILKEYSQMKSCSCQLGIIELEKSQKNGAAGCVSTVTATQLKALDELNRKKDDGSIEDPKRMKGLFGNCVNLVNIFNKSKDGSCSLPLPPKP